MMIYIDGHDFHYEMENLVRLFYPFEKLMVIHEIPETPEAPYVITELHRQAAGRQLRCSVCIGSFCETDTVENASSDEKTAERQMAVCLYGLLCRATGKQQHWGILTGVRPIKLFRRLSEQYGIPYAKDYFEKELLVSPRKTSLSALTEQHERKILELNRRDSFSLYVSVPFCPTRCSYCSFVSQTVESAGKLIEPYYELLCRELALTGKLAADCGLHLESVYIGGGTPTTFSAVQLSGVLKTITEHFDLSGCREFTVEAGRPDTITKEKLEAIYFGGADRISINPQTLNDSVLEVIGRRHNSEQTLAAYELAVKTGFRNINMDLIAGLPTDTPDSFRKSLDGVCELSPAGITVHTLAMKRSSRLTLQGYENRSEEEGSTSAMLGYCEEKLPQCGYHPYYLYRQTRMSENLENVGWSKTGYDGIYNVFVMDETHTILGCGAGAVSKLKDPDSESLTRIFNYKYPYEYINGFDEMLKRKEQVKSFYDQLS